MNLVANCSLRQKMENLGLLVECGSVWFTMVDHGLIWSDVSKHGKP